MERTGTGSSCAEGDPTAVGTAETTEAVDIAVPTTKSSPVAAGAELNPTEKVAEDDGTTEKDEGVDTAVPTTKSSPVAAGADLNPTEKVAEDEGTTEEDEGVDTAVPTTVPVSEGAELDPEDNIGDDVGITVLEAVDTAVSSPASSPVASGAEFGPEEDGKGFDAEATNEKHCGVPSATVSVLKDNSLGGKDKSLAERPPGSETRGEKRNSNGSVVTEVLGNSGSPVMSPQGNRWSSMSRLNAGVSLR